MADLNQVGSPQARARQLGLLADGYGLARSDRVGFVDRMIEFAVRATREEAIAYDVRPATPVLPPTASRWSGRSPGEHAPSAWTYDHRRILEEALGL